MNAQEFTVVGPDDIPLTLESFKSEQAAREYIPAWCKRYERQGYYRAGDGTLISLADLPKLCYITKDYP